MMTANFIYFLCPITMMYKHFVPIVRQQRESSVCYNVLDENGAKLQILSTLMLGLLQAVRNTISFVVVYINIHTRGIFCFLKTNIITDHRRREICFFIYIYIYIIFARITFLKKKYNCYTVERQWGAANHRREYIERENTLHSTHKKKT